MRQKQDLVEELRQAKYLNVVKDLPQVRIVEGSARFKGPRTVDVNGESITADRILIATGEDPIPMVWASKKQASNSTHRARFKSTTPSGRQPPGVYAAGDVIGVEQFVYTAAYEGALAAGNAFTRDDRIRDYSALGWVANVFALMSSGFKFGKICCTNIVSACAVVN